MAHSKELIKKIDLLLTYAKEHMEEPELEYYAVFFSVSDTRERARVFRGAADTLQGAIEAARAYAISGVDKFGIDAKWVKLDIVVKAEQLAPQKAVDEMFSSYNEFYRHGISLDKKYEFAYLEAEINGNRLLNYKDKLFDLRTFNEHSMRRDDDVLVSVPKQIIAFDCVQFFCDERDNVYELISEGLNCGRRKRAEEYMTQKEIQKVINSGVRFLANQMLMDGSFDYGYYPIRHKLIGGYNILRHASALWSMVCGAELSHDKELHTKAVLGIKYLLSQVEYYDDGCAYLIDQSQGEIKLGGNAVAIILLSQYMKLFESKEYVSVCEALGHGILKLFKGSNGEFIHVLEASDRSLKAEHRTVYYDGEAAFALCRLHGMTGSSLWIEAAATVVDHFIEADYIKYRDHWVAYALNELTMYKPEEKYFEFALRNAQENLETINDCITTYHTYLEMLMASYETYRRIVTEGYQVAYLEKFDARRLAEVIMHRADYMLNGYGYPEYVMYFKKPIFYKGAFFIRHDAYRCRIDDVQHFCGSYIALYKRYDEIIDLCQGQTS